jgi:diguanylate cyclase (GGDEF)-like protein/PAS domain S-box-containing protein
MTLKTVMPTSPKQIRARIDRRLASWQPSDALPPAAEILMHELRVKHIDLEMQNEELQRAYADLEESRDRYIDLYESSPACYLTLSRDGLIASINLTGANMFGVARKDLIMRRFSNLVTPEDDARWAQLFISIMNNDPLQVHELALQNKAGKIFHVQLSSQRITSSDNTTCARIALTDITTSKLSKEAQRIAAIAFNAKEGIFIANAKGIILKVNQAFTDIMGYSAREAVGQTAHLFRSGRQTEDFYRTMWETIYQTGSWQGEIWNRRKNGEVFPEWLTIASIMDEDDCVTHYVVTFTDITQRKDATDKVERLAFFDHLTQLPNRRYLLDRLHQAAANSARSKNYIALLFIDLDNFKTINDSLGHDIGDLLLVTVAQRLQTCVREGDTVARLGGDEFVIMLDNLGQHQDHAAAHAKVVGEQILASLNAPYQLASHRCNNTPSIGVTLFNSQDEGVSDMFKRADFAMYSAKKAGRNTIRFFDPDMQAAISARATLETDLRMALAANQFSLYFQMQVRSGHVFGAEALLRWHHPVRGVIAPMEFIPLAEESGLILPIGQWVLEAACVQLARWNMHPQMRYLRLAVNISARQFHQRDFCAQVSSAIKKAAISPHNLKLELTESLVLDDIEEAIRKMRELKAIGVGFSMDDFGTGFSSLAYLTQLPLFQLKIDRSFVHNIGRAPSDAMIVQTIIGMADSLGLEVIAEGVETEAQRMFLEQRGCPNCQGDLFGKPVSLAEFERLSHQQSQPEQRCA